MAQLLTTVAVTCMGMVIMGMVMGMLDGFDTGDDTCGFSDGFDNTWGRLPIRTDPYPWISDTKQSEQQQQRLHV